MKHFFKLLSIGLFISILATKIHAQEMLVPIDKNGKILVIDSELQKKLNLFPEYKNFQEAKLFKISENNFVLEVYYKKDEMNNNKSSWQIDFYPESILANKINDRYKMPLINIRYQF